MLGFARSLVVARTLGAHADSDAFFAAIQIPQIVYGPLIGSAVAAVLIPTFSRLADEDRDTFWLIVRTVFAAEILLTAVLACILELLARPLVIGVASGFLLGVHAAALSHAVRLVHVLLLGLLFSTSSGVAVATLYSLGRRAAASFAPACIHLGVIAAALLGAARFGAAALAVGAVAGGATQCAIQLADLLYGTRSQVVLGPRSGDLESPAPVESPAPRLPLADTPRETAFELLPRTRLIDLRHPILRHMLRLYIPVAGGAALALLGQVANLNFQSHLPANGELSGMQYATQLIQFPAGIVITALGFAVLPAMARHAESSQGTRYSSVLSFGLRASLIVTVPATLVLMLFAAPIVAVLFQHSRFLPSDTTYTVAALIGYAPQLPLLGINQLLVFAHYARQNTRVPAIAAAVGVGVFVIAALILFRFTITGLAIADTIAVASQSVVLAASLIRNPLSLGFLASTHHIPPWRHVPSRRRIPSWRRIP